MKIKVVGLGYRDERSLPLEIADLLMSDIPVILRTVKHGAVSWMQEKGINFQSFDHMYEQQQQFAEVYEQITESLFQKVSEVGELIYAVPGHPMVAERSVQLLLQQCDHRKVEVEIVGGISFLDGAFTRLQIDPIEGFALLDGSDLKASQLQPRIHLLIGQVYSRLVASNVKLTLMEVYPEEIEVTIATSLGIPEDEQLITLPLFELDHQEVFNDFTSIYVPPVNERWTLRRDFHTLVDLFAYLRGPDGCPWDRKQTHQSLTRYLIEETYEFLEAVSAEDEEAMMDELGDVLLQVMLHAQIAGESESFDIYDVMETLLNKMIRRHPHVFNQTGPSPSWEEIKQKEKSAEDPSNSSILEGIPQGMPALSQAVHLQKKAATVGFDWDRVEQIAAKMTEELMEFILAKSEQEKREEMGDLLFSVVNLSRFMGVDPEVALLGTCHKFKTRFQYLEQKARKQNCLLTDVSLEQLDQWWNEVKDQTAENQS